MLSAQLCSARSPANERPCINMVLGSMREYLGSGILVVIMLATVLIAAIRIVFNIAVPGDAPP